MKHRVRLERTDEGYAVWCPGLPGCWSQGATEEEALDNVKDAIQTYLATAEELTKDQTTRLVEVAVWPCRLSQGCLIAAPSRRLSGRASGWLVKANTSP